MLADTGARTRSGPRRPVPQRSTGLGKSAPDRSNIHAALGPALLASAAVVAQLAEAEVVDMEEQDVRSLSHAASPGSISPRLPARDEIGGRDQQRHWTAGDRASPMLRDTTPGPLPRTPLEPTTTGATPALAER
jgi:hypothetical protein